MTNTQAQDDGRTDVREVRTADGYMLDDVERAAYEALMRRLAWPSMHWGVEGVSAEAWPHLAIAAAVGARSALAAVSTAAPVWGADERCTLCGRHYPAPVHLHHSEDECAAPDPGPAPEYLTHANDDTPWGNNDDIVSWAFDKGIEYGTWRERKRVFDASRDRCSYCAREEQAVTPGIEANGVPTKICGDCAATPDEREVRVVTEAQADAARDLTLTLEYRAESPVAQKAMLLAALDLWTDKAVANGQYARWCARTRPALAARPAPVVSGADVLDEHLPSDLFDEVMTVLLSVATPERIRLADRLNVAVGASARRRMRTGVTMADAPAAERRCQYHYPYGSPGCPSCGDAPVEFAPAADDEGGQEK